MPIEPDPRSCRTLHEESMTPIDRLTTYRIDRVTQWAARLAICRAVHRRGAHPAPAFRIGSNAPGATADEYAVDEPCPACGASGADIVGGDAGGVGMEYCPACGEEWIVGDYDWRDLADCLRYRRDLAAGLVAE